MACGWANHTQEGPAAWRVTAGSFVSFPVKCRVNLYLRKLDRQAVDRRSNLLLIGENRWRIHQVWLLLGGAERHINKITAAAVSV